MYAIRSYYDDQLKRRVSATGGSLSQTRQTVSPVSLVGQAGAAGVVVRARLCQAGAFDPVTEKDLTAMQAILPDRFLLGECPRWDEQQQCLWWVDISRHQIHSLMPASGEHRSYQLDEEIGCLALRRQGGLVVGLRSGLALLPDPASGELIPLASPEADKPWQRFNDGRCDPAGRFIA